MYYAILFGIPTEFFLFAFDRGLFLLSVMMIFIFFYTKMSAEFYVKHPLQTKELPKELPKWELHIDKGPKMHTLFRGRPMGTMKAVAEPQRHIEEKALPNFDGKPHEILAVDEDANTSIILHSFRFWLKQYHPDHHVGQKQAVYTDRTRRLNDAKKTMLSSRRNRSACLQATKT